MQRLLKHESMTVHDRNANHVFFAFTLVMIITFVGLAAFDTARYASLHLGFAYALFVAMILATLINFSLWTRLRNSYTPEEIPNYDKMDLSFKLKLAAIIPFLIAIIIYLPVGVSISCEFQHLTMANCKGQEDLGESYCNDKQHPDEPENTILWDYTNCADINNVRALTQQLTVYLYFAYMLTFYLDIKYFWKSSRPLEKRDPLYGAIARQYKS
eukprot:GFYU01016088.1.p1 GENE.GFYU01016088.1~~GFYU01016088.1.p1  ORF type:complete len:214 (-),score=50.87 GFYU01016088.1:36-677(-)